MPLLRDFNFTKPKNLKEAIKLGLVFHDLKSLSQHLAPLRQAGKRLVFTNGCFDLLHVGHVRYLKEARGLGDLLLVAVNTDLSVKRLKGDARPVQTEADRAEILASLECVDLVVPFAEDTPIKVIETVRPDILVKGGDWPIDQIVGSSFVQSYGGIVRSLGFFKGKSTTLLISKIMSLG